jgi:hypothetical protein
MGTVYEANFQDSLTTAILPIEQSKWKRGSGRAEVEGAEEGEG